MNKRKALNNKGVAMETAIFFMITLSALASLIFAATYRNKLRDDQSSNRYTSTAQIDQIGESFFIEISSKYSSSLNGDDLISEISLDDAYVDKQKVQKKISYYTSYNNYEYYTLTLIINDIITNDYEELEDVERVILEVEVSVDTVNKKIKISKWRIDNPNSDYDYLGDSQKENGFDYEY